MSDKNIDWIKRLQLLKNALKENGVNSSLCVELETKISGYELDFTEHDKVFEDRIEELEKRVKELDRIDAIRIDEKRELKQRIAELESKEMEKPAKINLNEIVKVKLTPYGAEIYYKQFDELNKQRGREICKPHMPRIDKDGYTEFQLWHFIELYGEHIGMCKPNVIEPLEIVYCGNDKCHSDHAE